MHAGIYVALSGAKLQELRLETVANNLANSNTSGYKSDRVTSRSFQFELEGAYNELDNFEELKHIDRLDDFDLTLGPYNGVYSETVQVGTSFNQGDHRFTGNPLNISLDGPGAFLPLPSMKPATVVFYYQFDIFQYKTPLLPLQRASGRNNKLQKTK